MRMPCTFCHRVYDVEEYMCRIDPGYKMYVATCISCIDRLEYDEGITPEYLKNCNKYEGIYEEESKYQDDPDEYSFNINDF